MRITINVHVHPDEGVRGRLEGFRRDVRKWLGEFDAVRSERTRRVERNVEALMAAFEELQALVQQIDQRTTEIGHTVATNGSTIGAIAEAQGKLALAIEDVSGDIQRLRDNLGGEGGLKAGEANQVRSGLEAVLSKLEPMVTQATEQASTLQGVQASLMGQATVLEAIGASVPTPEPEPNPGEGEGGGDQPAGVERPGGLGGETQQEG